MSNEKKTRKPPGPTQPRFVEVPSMDPHDVLSLRKRRRVAPARRRAVGRGHVGPGVCLDVLPAVDLTSIC